jgi:hypothetical protein
MHPRSIATRYPPNRPRRFNAPVLMFPYEDTPCAPNKFDSGEMQALSIHDDHVNGYVAAPVTRAGVLGLCALVKFQSPQTTANDPDGAEMPFRWPKMAECRLLRC